MKKTIKSIIIGLALTITANGQRSLTLDDIDHLYKNAVSRSAQKSLSAVTDLKINYAHALKAYRESLFSVRNIDSVAAIAAIDKELANWEESDGALKPLVEGADKKMKTFREHYEKKLAEIAVESEENGQTLRKVLVAQLEALQKSLVKSGDMRGALVVHDRLKKLGAGIEVEEVEEPAELDSKSMVITTDKGYVNVRSKQKLKLTPGDEYTLTFFAKFEGKEINTHDCLPRFFQKDGSTFEGGDGNEMQKAQRHSEERTISSALDGWDKVTVKFTHFYEVQVVLGLEFYDVDSYQITMKNFTLTDSEGKNLITKNLNSSSGWESSKNTSFTK